jgi:hypothetical protein
VHYKSKPLTRNQPGSLAGKNRLANRKIWITTLSECFFYFSIFPPGTKIAQTMKNLKSVSVFVVFYFFLSQKSRHFIAEVSHYQRTKIIALAHNENVLTSVGCVGGGLRNERSE